MRVSPGHALAVWSRNFTMYRRTWKALNADRPFYDDYQSRCTRRIPLIRLPGRAG